MHRICLVILRRLRLAKARLRFPGVRFGRRCDVQPGLSIRLGSKGIVIFGAACVLDRYLTVESHGQLVVGTAE